VHEKADVIRDDDNRPVRMIGTAQDITDRRQLELQPKNWPSSPAPGWRAAPSGHRLYPFP
jgi:hypothetical protein